MCAKKTAPDMSDKTSQKAGLPPGTLVHIGEHDREETRISILGYDENSSELHRDVSPKDSLALSRSKAVSWINVSGVHDTALIEEIGRLFGLHHLLLEDVVHTRQRPKVEVYDHTLFIVLKMLTFDPEQSEVREEQISLVLGNGWVLSFQEKEGDVFDSVRDRIAHSKGRIRKLGSDYLAYALVDAVVDHYFGVLEQIGDRIEDLQDEVLMRPRSEILETVHEAKQELIFVRHAIWPLRDALYQVVRGEFEQISEHVEVYFRDVLDHTKQVLDSLESFRDTLAGTLDTYLSSLSHRMNEVMEVLTVIATLFIPLTFIVGVYGMNFKYMPELSWRYGYPAVWVVMIILVVAMLYWFKRRKWF